MVIWELYKAWRRGERRVKGSPMRGRCFEKKGQLNDPNSGNHNKATAEPTMKITSMKVIRKDGTTEDIDCG